MSNQIQLKASKFSGLGNEILLVDLIRQTGQIDSNSVKKVIEENQVQLSPEQRVYAEDYIQKKIGNYWLKIGQKLEIQKSLVQEAVSKSQTLTKAQLENLKNFVEIITAF